LTSWTSGKQHLALDKLDKYHLALDKWLCHRRSNDWRRPPVPTRMQAKGKGIGPYKRQISEAFPRDEREVVARQEPVATVAAIAAVQEATEAATRKSGRPR